MSGASCLSFIEIILGALFVTVIAPPLILLGLVALLPVYVGFVCLLALTFLGQCFLEIVQWLRQLQR